MSDKENSEIQGNDEQEEVFTRGGCIYVGATLACNGRLQEAREQFQTQVDSLNGCLFLVDEQVSIEGRIPTEVALTYLEVLKDVISDARDDLDDVEQIASELFEALEREVKSEREAQPSPDPYSLLRGWRACMASTRPSDWEQIVSHLLIDTDAALASAGAAARKTKRRERERSTEGSGGA